MSLVGSCPSRMPVREESTLQLRPVALRPQVEKTVNKLTLRMPHQLFIGGAFVDAEGAKTYETINPTDGSVSAGPAPPCPAQAPDAPSPIYSPSPVWGPLGPGWGPLLGRENVTVSLQPFLWERRRGRCGGEGGGDAGGLWRVCSRAKPSQGGNGGHSLPSTPQEQPQRREGPPRILGLSRRPGCSCPAQCTRMALSLSCTLTHSFLQTRTAEDRASERSSEGSLKK